MSNQFTIIAEANKPNYPVNNTVKEKEPVQELDDNEDADIAAWLRKINVHPDYADEALYGMGSNLDVDDMYEGALYAQGFDMVTDEDEEEDEEEASCAYEDYAYVVEILSTLVDSLTTHFGAAGMPVEIYEAYSDAYDYVEQFNELNYDTSTEE